MIISFASQDYYVNYDGILIPGIFIFIGSVIGSLVSLKFALPILKVVVS